MPVSGSLRGIRLVIRPYFATFRRRLRTSHGHQLTLLGCVAASGSSVEWIKPWLRSPWLLIMLQC